MISHPEGRRLLREAAALLAQEPNVVDPLTLGSPLGDLLADCARDEFPSDDAVAVALAVLGRDEP